MPAMQALELITAPDGTKEAFEKELKQARDYMSTLEVPDLDDYGEEEKIVAYPDPHDKWMKLRIPTSVETVEDMVDFFKKEHNLTMQSWSMSKRTEDGKVTGVCVCLCRKRDDVNVWSVNAHRPFPRCDVTDHLTFVRDDRREAVSARGDFGPFSASGCLRVHGGFICAFVVCEPPLLLSVKKARPWRSSISDISDTSSPMHD